MGAEETNNRANLQPVRLAGGWCWFVLREKYSWLVADKPNKRGVVWAFQQKKGKSLHQALFQNSSLFFLRVRTLPSLCGDHSY
jgi:hypothetical protein